jgi:hypothetical protein
MKKTVLIILLFAVLGFLSCSSPPKKSEEKKDRAGHVYNPSAPLKGEITLEVEERLEIDSSSVNVPEGKHRVFFSTARKSANKDLYMVNMSAVEIFAFSPQGEFRRRFLSKGEGPGEHKYSSFSVQILDNHLWAPGPGKIIRFEANGKVVEEIRLQKKYRNIEMVDKDRFIGNLILYNENEKDPSKRTKAICALFDRNEKVLDTYFEAYGAELTYVRAKVGETTTRVNFSASAVTPKILHRLSLDRRFFYLSLSSDYVIFIKDLSGRVLKVIHKEHRPLALSANDRRELVDRFFFKQPPHIKQLIRENLPARFCAISFLQPLKNGFLAVYSVAGLESSQVDIFDAGGKYVYRLKLPEELRGKHPRFDRDGLYIIDTDEERQVYREYTIKNLPEIFGKVVGLF